MYLLDMLVDAVMTEMLTNYIFTIKCHCLVCKCVIEIDDQQYLIYITDSRVL